MRRSVGIGLLVVSMLALFILAMQSLQRGARSVLPPKVVSPVRLAKAPKPVATPLPKRPKAKPRKSRSVKRYQRSNTRITVVEGADFRTAWWPIPRSRDQAERFFSRTMHVLVVFPSAYFDPKPLQKGESGPKQAIGPFVANGELLKDGKVIKGRDLFVAYRDRSAVSGADWAQVKPEIAQQKVESVSLLGPKLPITDWRDVPGDWWGHEPTSWAAIKHSGDTTILIEKEDATFDQMNRDRWVVKHKPSAADSGKSLCEGTYYFTCIGWRK